MNHEINVKTVVIFFIVREREIEREIEKERVVLGRSLPPHSIPNVYCT